MARKILVKTKTSIGWIEAGMFVLLGCFAIGLIVTVCKNAGPLWRDEINTVWMAQRSTISELWRWLEFDSFPILWFEIVKAWINLGLGDTDVGLRVLGAWVGVGQLLAMWYVARVQSKRVPLLFYALFALNPVMFYWGTSLRAYGMGIVTMLVMFAAVWAYVDRPNARRWLWALLASLVAVQTLYYNSLVLAAMIAAGIGSFVFLKRWRPIASLILLGVLSAASVVPYVIGPMTRAQNWRELAQNSQLSLTQIFQSCGQVMGNNIELIQWSWLVLSCLVFFGLLIRFWKWHSIRRRSRAIFLIILLPVLWVMHIRFLKLLGYHTNPWYFATLFAVTALTIDRGADLLFRRSSWARCAGLVIVLVLLISSTQSNWIEAHVRHTSMDVVADTLTQKASAEDFILVSPYWLGISFHRYYHGPTAYSTIPSLSDLSLHRFDLVKQQISDPGAIEPLLKQIEHTLQAGHHVWFIGEPEFLNKDKPITMPFNDMNSVQRLYYWKLMVGDVLEKNAISMRKIEYPIEQPIRPSQKTSLYLFTSAKKNG